MYFFKLGYVAVPGATRGSHGLQTPGSADVFPALVSSSRVVPAAVTRETDEMLMINLMDTGVVLFDRIDESCSPFVGCHPRFNAVQAVHWQPSGWGRITTLGN